MTSSRRKTSIRKGGRDEQRRAAILRSQSVDAAHQALRGSSTLRRERVWARTSVAEFVLDDVIRAAESSRRIRWSGGPGLGCDVELANRVARAPRSRWIQAGRGALDVFQSIPPTCRSSRPTL